MTETVDWRADGIPRSARFDDIYHTESGAPAQARHVFLGVCGLPRAWARQPQWRILETGFGFGLNFLTTWQAWRADPQRPRLLNFVSIEAFPVSREDLLRAAAGSDLLGLAECLAAQWHGLLPGFHRLCLDEGRVMLNLCIGDVQAMLRAQRFEADSIFLDGFSPQRNPAMWSAETLKAVSRFAGRGTRVATWTIARAVCDALAQNGFQVEKSPGLPPKRDCLQGVFEPAWHVRRRGPAPSPAAVAGRCVVIGAGLAGGAVAASLARRGWEVEVLEATDRAAAGASGLPVGMLAPHVSPDDALLSRLTRAGVRATWQQLDQLLAEGVDWRASGVLERRAAGDDRLPQGWTADGPNESWHASPTQLAEAGLSLEAVALWHARGAWVRPSRLIDAWLAWPGIRVRLGCRAAHIVRIDGEVARWAVRDVDGTLLAEADRIVIAAGIESHVLAPELPLQAVRGQVEWGLMPEGARLPATPLNGDGHLIAGVPAAEGKLWLAGATFDRDSSDVTPRASDTEFNRGRLARLHPEAAAQLASAFAHGETHTWAGIRCASGDRRPLVGPLSPESADDVWLCTALGSRGLSFAVLCAELLAAHWHREPLPLPAKLAQALDARRAWPEKETSQRLASAM